MADDHSLNARVPEGETVWSFDGCLFRILNSSLQEAEGEYKAALAANPFEEESERRLGEIAAVRGDQKEADEDSRDPYSFKAMTRKRTSTWQRY